MQDFNELMNRESPQGGSIGDRISFLVRANNGFNVTGWGFISYSNDHQYGLEQNDAIELLEWCSKFDGMEFAGLPAFELFKPFYDAYNQKMKCLQGKSFEKDN